jgi:hypothetical protein
MIHVDEKDEPPNFHERVRNRGRLFLRGKGRRKPTATEWRTHSYWREIGPELHNAYGGICAYSCHWIPHDTGADTVEHFRPKDRYPKQAYEWSNYRLVCATLNGRKGRFGDVLDPFEVRNGWFVIDFPSMLIRPGLGLQAARRGSVQASIDRLGLNDEGTCLKSRVKWVRDYCSKDISLEYLRTHAPHIAAELQRQNLIEAIRDVFII